MKRFHAVLILCLPIGILSGCLSQQAMMERRIEARSQVFQALSPDDQWRVRKGEVRIGDGQDVVWIARGQPERIYRRVTSGGTNTVWSYTQRRVNADTDLVPVTVWSRDSRGGMTPTTEFVWLDRNSTHEYEIFRVEFRAGRVTAIEGLDPAE